MDCAAAILALAALAVLPVALAAYRSARSAGVRLASLETETARLRQLLEGAQAPAHGAGSLAPLPLTEPGDRRPSPPESTPPQLVAPSSAAPAGAVRHGGFEELVGGRVLPWIAAMALAFAGAYLVKYSFERGWISPPVRVAMGVAFGIGLLGFSMLLRRSAGRISEALAAAGVADLFASFLAAVHVYHLVAPAAGFGLMALTTAVAVALSLRQGIMVALLGLVGGFLTPALVHTAQPAARNLFGYLLLLVAGLLAVARRRTWPWLGFAALAAALLWAAVWLAAPFRGGGADAEWLSLFLLLLAAAAAISATTPAAAAAADSAGAGQPPLRAGREASWTDRTGAPTAVLLPVAAALALLAGTVARSGYAFDEWAFVGLLAAGILVLAWLEPRHLPLAWIAAATVAVLLAAWGTDMARVGAARFLAIAVSAWALFAVAGWGAAVAEPGRRLRRPMSGAPTGAAPRPAGMAPTGGAPRSGLWAALSAAVGVAFFLVAWTAAHRSAGSPVAWSAAALALAALYLAAALPVARRRRSRPDLGAALAASGCAVTSLVSLAVPIALGRDSLAVAWALEVVALVWLAQRLEVPVLSTLARLLALAAVFGALSSPAALRAAGELPLLNELLYAYGLPLAALAAAAWLAARQPAATARSGRLASELQWEALILLFALVTLEVDQPFQPAAGSGFAPRLTECAAVTAAWFLLGWGLLRAVRAWRPATGQLREVAAVPTRRAPIELAGRLIVAAALGAVLLGAGLAVNPLWSHQAVGSSPLWNALLFAYALPAWLALLAASEVSRQGGRRLASAARIVALALGFAWVSLEVRQLFHGTYLELAAGSHSGSGPDGSTAGERYAYSAAWVLYGVALLLAGIARRGAVLRYGSLGVMLLAVLKVFLYDTARLSDLYRVLSFLGLGASLLLLAFLYQRYILNARLSS
jgi:uncharacterized membrane protein